MYLFSKKSTPELTAPLPTASSQQQGSSSSSTIPTPEVAIANIHASLTRLVEAESDLTGVSLDVLERNNWTASSRYSALAESTRKSLESDSEKIKVSNQEIKDCIKAVDDIHQYVLDLEVLTKEIDEWSKEIEVKSRRYKPK